MAGKPAHCLGNPQLPHTLTYIDDFARALVRVGQAPQAHGQVWHAPSAAPCSMQGMVEIIARQCGTAPRLRTAPRWLLKAVGLFNAEWREMDEVYDQYEQPWVMDSSKYQQHFGDAPTSHETAIRQTLAALR
jgi:nucleoside-diphosphate-sugar epimerase